MYHAIFIYWQPPSGGCVLKPSLRFCVSESCDAAAFGRLCVETYQFFNIVNLLKQPPSGGCVLKHINVLHVTANELQPPSGGCVLKPSRSSLKRKMERQPPSGGCVLKRPKDGDKKDISQAAAFGWLCVETCRSREIKSNV